MLDHTILPDPGVLYLKKHLCEGREHRARRNHHEPRTLKRAAHCGTNPPPDPTRNR